MARGWRGTNVALESRGVPRIRDRAAALEVDGAPVPDAVAWPAVDGVSSAAIAINISANSGVHLPRMAPLPRSVCTQVIQVISATSSGSTLLVRWQERLRW